MMTKIHRKSERGATALFIVIFSILLMSTITISFLSLMVNEQQRSTNNELSQSAYDSALAGVEDAKRAIVAARSGDFTAQAALEASRESDGCQVIGSYVNGITDDVNETPIQSSTSSAGAELNQAYTCLEVNNLSDDYRTTVEDGQLVMVPLRMADSINQLTISWQRPSEMAGGAEVSLGNGTNNNLLSKPAWNQGNYPAMLRLQTITPSGSFTLDDFNSATTSSTAFLYPAMVGAGDSVHIPMPERAGEDLSTPNQPEPVACDETPNVLLDSYICSVTVDLQRTVPGGSEFSYLVVRPIYRGASIMIEGKMDDRLVQFDGAQPIVDSTGRANDLFRRVEARLTMGGAGERGSGLGGVIPHYALDVDGSICKNFYVSSRSSGSSQPDCRP